MSTGVGLQLRLSQAWKPNLNSSFCSATDLVLLVIEGNWVLGKAFATQHASDPLWDLTMELCHQPAAQPLNFKNAVAAAAGDVLVETPLRLLNYLMELPAAQARALHAMVSHVIVNYVGVINMLLEGTFEPGIEEKIVEPLGEFFGAAALCC